MKFNYRENNGRFLETKSAKINKILQTISIYGLLLLILTFMIWCSCHEVKIVSGQSMQPTINETYSKTSDKFDLVLVNTKVGTIQKQQIVVIDFSDYNQDELIIKRVIATAGDSIKITFDYDNYKSIVWLKQKGSDSFIQLNENYTKSEKLLDVSKTCAKTFQKGVLEGQVKTDSLYIWDTDGYTKNDDGSITINEGYFFALGDNRENSLDSSEIGPFKTEKVTAIAETIVKDGTLLNTILRKLFNLSLTKTKF